MGFGVGEGVGEGIGEGVGVGVQSCGIGKQDILSARLSLVLDMLLSEKKMRV